MRSICSTIYRVNGTGLNPNLSSSRWALSYSRLLDFLSSRWAVRVNGSEHIQEISKWKFSPSHVSSPVDPWHQKLCLIAGSYLHISEEPQSIMLVAFGPRRGWRLRNKSHFSKNYVSSYYWSTISQPV